MPFSLHCGYSRVVEQYGWSETIWERQKHCVPVCVRGTGQVSKNLMCKEIFRFVSQFCDSCIWHMCLFCDQILIWVQLKGLLKEWAGQRTMNQYMGSFVTWSRWEQCRLLHLKECTVKPADLSGDNSPFSPPWRNPECPGLFVFSRMCPFLNAAHLEIDYPRTISSNSVSVRIPNISSAWYFFPPPTFFHLLKQSFF